MICNAFKCKPDLESALVNDQTLDCYLPALPNVYSSNNYNTKGFPISEQRLLTWTSSNASSTARLYDIDTIKSFSSTGTCFGKVASNTGYALNVRKVRVFFKDPTTSPFPFIGLTIKTTSLANAVTTSYTFNETARSGWNTVEISGQYLAIEIGGSSGCDHITEIDIVGDVILADSDTSKVCDIKVQGTGAAVAVTGSVTYQNSLTSVITSISPNFGSAYGGDTITIHGTGLSTSLELIIGGIPCESVAEVVATTRYTCVT